jgi:hypothetical protein
MTDFVKKTRFMAFDAGDFLMNAFVPPGHGSFHNVAGCAGTGVPVNMMPPEQTG